MERVTRGLAWLVHDHERDNHGDQARNLWTGTYGEMVERFAEDQPQPMALVLLGGGRAFFTEEHLQAAFPEKRNCDTVIDFGGDVVLAEIVSGTVTVPTRAGERKGLPLGRRSGLCWKKPARFTRPARNLLRDPQPANSPLTQADRADFPVVVCGGQFPINSLTTQYITEELSRAPRPDAASVAASLAGVRPTPLPRSAITSPTSTAAASSADPAVSGTPWRIRCSPSSGAWASKIQSTCARLVLDDLAGPGRSCCPWPADSQTTSSRQPR